MTDDMIKMTAAASLSAIEEARALALAIGKSPADVDTYRAEGPLWRDAAGYLFAITAGTVTEGFVAHVSDPAPLPPRDWPCDLALAEAGRALLDKGSLDQPPVPTPGRIAVILGADPLAALAAMGLVPVEAAP